MEVLLPISTSFKIVFGPIDTLSPSFTTPSKIDEMPNYGLISTDIIFHCHKHF